MDLIALKKLVKKDLLIRFWRNIDQVVGGLNVNQSNISIDITGGHSWFSDASNNSEDIRISSLIRVLEKVNEHLKAEEEKIDFSKVFTEQILDRASLLNYLSSTQEDMTSIKNIILEHQEEFDEIRITLGPLYQLEKLNHSSLVKGYEELGQILNELEGEGYGK